MAEEKKRKPFSFHDPVTKTSQIAYEDPTFGEMARESVSPVGTRAAIDAARAARKKYAPK